MTSMSDISAPTGATPRCPSWCTFPPDHDLPETDVDRTDLVRREHGRPMLGDHDIGWVELYQLDQSVGADGPTIVGPHLVLVVCPTNGLSATAARVLAEALLQAAEVIERPDGGQR